MQTLLMNPNGSVHGIPRSRLQEIPFFLTTNRPNDVVSLTADAVSGPFAMTAAGETPLLITALYTEQDPSSKLTIELQEGNERRRLSHGAVHTTTIFGNNTTGSFRGPYWLPEPLYVDAVRKLQLTITDLSSAAQPTYLIALGSRTTRDAANKVREWQKFSGFMSLPFFYTFDSGAVTLALNSTSEQVITIEDDHHFLLTHLTATSTGTFSLEITDLLTGESMVHAPQDKSYRLVHGAIVGIGQNQFKLAQPRFFGMNQKILVSLKDTSGAANTVYLTLGGRALGDREWR